VSFLLFVSGVFCFLSGALLIDSQNEWETCTRGRRVLKWEVCKDIERRRHYPIWTWTWIHNIYIYH